MPRSTPRTLSTNSRRRPSSPSSPRPRKQASTSPRRQNASRGSSRRKASQQTDMDLQLKGKKVLITGGSKGIGLACARAFIAEGARVAIVSRSQENLNQGKKALGNAYTIATDLIDAAAAAAMVERVEKEFGPIDILVNSAGAAQRTDADDLTPAAWRASMDAKYFTYINVIDPLIKKMGARGNGVVINIIGSGGKVASPTHHSGGAAN